MWMFVGFNFVFFNFFVKINFLEEKLIMMYLCCLSFGISSLLFFWKVLIEESGFCMIDRVFRVIYVLFIFCNFVLICKFLEFVIIEYLLFMMYGVVKYCFGMF